MFKPIKIIIIKFLIILIAMTLILTGCGNAEKDASITEDFGFILKYGVGAKNALDTVAGTFTRDLVTDGTATTELRLTKREMEQVYRAMQEIDIFSYPDEFDPRSDVFVTPYNTYHLKIQYGDQVKEISWKDEHISEDAQAVRLRNLIESIINMIEKKKEFKKLPEPGGWYV